MRFLLFYGSVDSLNHYTDAIEMRLRELEHETYIVDTVKFDENEVLKWVSATVHGAILFDGIGFWMKELFDKLHIPVINILVDHPMTFGYCMKSPPQKYIQFSPDEYHVEFSKRFYNIENTFFLPHMGTLFEKNRDTFIVKEIPLLFGGWYKPYNESYQIIKSNYPDKIKLLFFEVITLLLERNYLPLEIAFEQCLENLGWEISDKQLASALRLAKPVDEFIRMYYRSRVLETIIKSGMPITIIGAGWEKFAPASMKNVHRLSRVNFKDMEQYMQRAEIVLNVMPWFKAGTHERIFNALLCGACPFTDSNPWLLEHFPEKEMCMYYSLGELDRIPMQIYDLHNDASLRAKVISQGKEYVLRDYSSEKIVDIILRKLEECYGYK